MGRDSIKPLLLRSELGSEQVHFANHAMRCVPSSVVSERRDGGSSGSRPDSLLLGLTTFNSHTGSGLNARE